MIELEEFLEIVEELSAEIPPEFFEELNGGVRVLEDCKINPHATSDDLVIMGEYHSGSVMGNHIVIYYGSFMRVYGHLSPEALKEQVRKTLRHEFRHHLERRSGLKDLEIEDRIQLLDYLRDKPEEQLVLGSMLFIIEERFSSKK